MNNISKMIALLLAFTTIAMPYPFYANDIQQNADVLPLENDASDDSDDIDDSDEMIDGLTLIEQIGKPAFIELCLTKLDIDIVLGHLAHLNYDIVKDKIDTKLNLLPHTDYSKQYINSNVSQDNDNSIDDESGLLFHKVKKTISETMTHEKQIFKFVENQNRFKKYLSNNEQIIASWIPQSIIDAYEDLSNKLTPCEILIYLLEDQGGIEKLNHIGSGLKDLWYFSAAIEPLVYVIDESGVLSDNKSKAELYSILYIHAQSIINQGTPEQQSLLHILYTPEKMAQEMEKTNARECTYQGEHVVPNFLC